MGLIVGFITPLLRNAIFGTPPLINAAAMALELTTYGFMIGFYTGVLKRRMCLFMRH